MPFEHNVKIIASSMFLRTIKAKTIFRCSKVLLSSQNRMGQTWFQLQKMLGLWLELEHAGSYPSKTLYDERAKYCESFVCELKLRSDLARSRKRSFS
mmetsp:Transcript_18132/g.41779  ORF Transcript_18132/g.41779 Transcript_18132/m.41779 type:complete len:97 (-) Transcript_18132:1226-1516(-)